MLVAGQRTKLGPQKRRSTLDGQGLDDQGRSRPNKRKREEKKDDHAGGTGWTDKAWTIKDGHFWTNKRRSYYVQGRRDLDLDLDLDLGLDLDLDLDLEIILRTRTKRLRLRLKLKT